MPTNKPATNLDWCTTGGANIVAPVAGVIASGWVPAQKPPAQNMNWWMNLAGLWADYTRDLELAINPHSWVQTSGSDLVGNRTVTVGTNRQLIDVLQGTTQHTRLY